MKSRVGKTEIVSTYYTRRKARKIEEELTDILPHLDENTHETHHGAFPVETFDGKTVFVPIWAGGFRVENAGLFQHAVVATEGVGH